MSIVEVKTADLIGRALDWAVLSIERPESAGGNVDCVHRFDTDGGVRALYLEDGDLLSVFTARYSVDWSQGGPLIEKHQIELKWEGIDGKAYWWSATHQDVVQFQLGDKPLIAACRAIVAAKIGDTVQVPEKLLS